MAVYHVPIFLTIIFIWHILASAQATYESRETYVAPDKSRRLFIYQPLRSMRKVSQRAFQDMNLFTARGYGKRADCFGNRLCGKRMPQFSGARLYGKRNIDMNQLKCFFIDCLELEKDMRDTDYHSRKFRRDDEIHLPE